MTEQTELSERARWYLANFTPGQVAEFAAAQEAEVVALTAGAEPYDDERVAPTPGQWIMLFNRATQEERLAMAALVLDERARLNHYTWTERIQLTEQAEAAKDALTRVLQLAEVLPAETGALIRAAVDGLPIDVRVEQDASFLTDEIKLTVRYPGGRPVETLACNECGKVRHLGSTCEEAAAGRHPLMEWLAREAERAVRESRDHKLGPLFAVSSEDVADAQLGQYAEPANTPLRPETVAALSEALDEYPATDRQRLRNLEAERITERLTAAGFDVVQTDLSLPDGYVHLRPGRLMVRREPWWVKGCAVCRQPDGFCDCPEVES